MLEKRHNHGGGGSSSEGMSMALHFGISDPVLFQGLVPANNWQYLLVLVGLVLLPIVQQSLNRLQDLVTRNLSVMKAMRRKQPSAAQLLVEDDQFRLADADPITGDLSMELRSVRGANFKSGENNEAAEASGVGRRGRTRLSGFGKVMAQLPAKLAQFPFTVIRMIVSFGIMLTVMQVCLI
ncbi:hypothetical protein BC830DRAFT_336042 [Chytriomyces sp. MP71]|nr:hypothetical protein BC830DRAFT_336042 [Chytriomyces sp. MP71]